MYCLYNFRNVPPPLHVVTLNLCLLTLFVKIICFSNLVVCYTFVGPRWPIESVLSIHPSVCAYVTRLLKNRSWDRSETFRDVQDQNFKKRTRARFFEKMLVFQKNRAFSQKCWKSRFFALCRKTLHYYYFLFFKWPYKVPLPTPTTLVDRVTTLLFYLLYGAKFGPKMFYLRIIFIPNLATIEAKF